MRLHKLILLVPMIAGAQTGILLLAHGGRAEWNGEVNQLAAQVEKSMPVEVAFGMASRQAMQEAVDRLVHRGVREIVAVPLFVSSHSSVITATQYLLGVRAEAPPELAIYAGMHHGGGSHAEAAPLTPVKSPVPIRMTAALDRSPIVAEILLARAKSISTDPAREVAIVVAHGPVSDEENALWLADMSALAEGMRGVFRRVEYLTVRDDAPEPVRDQAAAELRAKAESALHENCRVLIVPLLISFGGIEKGIQKRLAGLDFSMSPKALLPDERLVQWVLLSAKPTTR